MQHLSQETRHAEHKRVPFLSGTVLTSPSLPTQTDNRAKLRVKSIISFYSYAISSGIAGKFIIEDKQVVKQKESLTTQVSSNYANGKQSYFLGE